MAELPRYQGVQQRATGDASIAHKVQASSMDTFINSLEGFKRTTTQMIQDDAVQRAKQDAEQAFTEEGLDAKVNNELTAYGDAYTASLHNLHKKKVSIDTTARMNDIYTEHESNPAAFKEVSDAYYKKTSEGLPEHLRADFAVDFEAVKANHFAKVKQNRIRLDKEEDFATNNDVFTTQYEEATRFMREGNGARSLYSMQKALDANEDNYNKEYITADQYEKNKNLIQRGVSKSNFKSINDNYIEDNDLQGAQDYITDFRKSDAVGFTDDQREALADDMQADLNREINRQKAEADRGSKFDNKRADELIYLYDNLENVEDVELEEALKGNISPDKHDKLVQAYKDSGAMKVFSSMNIEAQEAEVLEERKNENKTADGLRLLKRKEKALESLKKLKSTNPIEYTEKYLGQKLETLDITDDNFASKALSRTDFIENVEITSGIRTGLFKPSEIADTKRKIDAMGVEDKLSFLADINMVDEKIANRTYEELGGGIGFAGYLSLIGNQSATATTLLGSTSKLPLEPKFKAEIAQKLINAFPHKADMYIAGAEDYARGYELETGNKPDIDDVIKNTLGTAVKKNGRSFFLPYGSTKNQFDNWIENIEIEGRPELTNSLNQINDLWGDRGVQLQQIGNGRYAVISTIDGASFVEMDSTDDTKPLILEFGK